jgi:hypothetical protein
MGMAGVWGILELFREFYSEMVLYVVFVVGRSYDEYTAEIAPSSSSSPSYRLCIFSLSRPFLSTHLLSFWMLVFSFSFYQSYPLPLPSPSLSHLLPPFISFPSSPLHLLQACCSILYCNRRQTLSHSNIVLRV